MMQMNFSMKSASLALVVALLIAGCASGGSKSSTSQTITGSESRPAPKCGTGETLMCQTGKTGFGRLSTGRKTNYDYCTCEPDSVVIQDRSLPQY